MVFGLGDTRQHRLRLLWAEGVVRIIGLNHTANVLQCWGKVRALRYQVHMLVQKDQIKFVGIKAVCILVYIWQ